MLPEGIVECEAGDDRAAGRVDVEVLPMSRVRVRVEIQVLPIGMSSHACGLVGPAIYGTHSCANITSCANHHP